MGEVGKRDGRRKIEGNGERRQTCSILSWAHDFHFLAFMKTDRKDEKRQKETRRSRKKTQKTRENKTRARKKRNDFW